MHELFASMNEYFQSLGLWGLALNSFIESFFLVPPPDFLLIVMDLAKPEKALLYATVCTIASAFGGATGYAINPARDLSPRIAHAILPIKGKRDSGWGYSWVPVAGPLAGGIAAALSYILLF